MTAMTQSRRQFLATVAAGGAAALAGCINPEQGLFNNPGGGSARLTARPVAPTITTAPGSYLITDARPLDGVLVVPSSYKPNVPMPLVVGLHGAGGQATGQVSLLGGLAESAGFLLLAVGARGITWDVFTSKYSYDVAFIDSALKWAFQRVNVDPQHLAIEGFSDGASYSLGLAMANGDLFTHAIIFSAGFIPQSDSPAVGKSRFFESHGTLDGVLRIETAARQIVPVLRGNGYSVLYQEFDGGHEVPSAIAQQAVSWFLS
jgi:phospholipase/carboxylesterase